MNEPRDIKAIIVGCIHCETIINLEDQIFMDQIGGSLAYAASGFRFWANYPGLVAKISPNTPDELSHQFNKWGMDTLGVRKNNIDHEMRAFYRVLDEDNYDSENPIKYFGSLNKQLPKNLLGYTGLSFANDSRKYSSPITLFPDDIPEPYLRSTSALLCSTDFLSMRMLPPHLRLNGIRTLLLKPSAGSMNSQFWNDFPVLVRGCTGLICTKKEALNLFLDKSENLLEIAETITSYGLEFVVITCGKDGQILFIRSERTHWQVPAFPTKVIDCIHSSDTFSGSFLAGFLKNYDPLMATFYGNIASSIKIEGSGATYLLDALPELAVARMNVLKDRARKI